ncbi:hypothetical protein [Streptomyces sp. NPDC053079]|uniref:hypothetical protein n=1 Tax=Streptomyces sp. NPDC053079 TaxID=3365697 RepID=UPI0037CF45D1
MTRHTASTITDDALDALYARLDAYDSRATQHCETPAHGAERRADERPACCICPRTLWADEQHRYACRLCEQRITAHLAQLPDLVRDLHGLLLPGVHTAAPACRTRASSEPAAPIRLDVLDVITSVTATLDSWLRDWHEHLSWDAPAYRNDPLAEAAAALRANLPWAVEEHAAVNEFAAEINDLHRTATGMLDPAKRARRIGRCPVPVLDEIGRRGTCGAVLRYVPGATTVTCPWCRATWDALDLSAALAAEADGALY